MFDPEIMIPPKHTNSKLQDSFLTTNFPTISYCFPDVVKPYVNREQNGFQNDRVEELFTQLQDQIFQAMAGDQLLSKMTKKQFEELPKKDQLKILQDNLHLIAANKKAIEFLEASKK